MNTKLRSFLFVLLAMGVAGFTFSRRATTEPLPAEPRSAEAVTGTTNITLNYQGQLNNGTAPVNGSATFIFKLYNTLTGGTECWSETQTLNVQNGLFNALLGSVTAIPDSCVVNDTYLELVVNNTTLSPRELVNQFANTIASGTTTRGRATISSNMQVLGDNTQPEATADFAFGLPSITIGQMPYSSSMLGGYSLANAYGSTITSGTDWAFFGLKGDTVDNKDAVIAWGDDTNKLSFIFGHDETNPVEVMSLSKEGILNVAGNADFSGNLNVGGKLTMGDWIDSPANTNLTIDPGAGTLNTIQLLDNVHVFGNLSVTGPDIVLQAGGDRGDGGRAIVHDVADKLAINYAQDFAGGTDIYGPVKIIGGCSAASTNSSSVAQSEECEVASLTTESVVASSIEAKSIASGGFVEINLPVKVGMKQGDLLCWSAEAQQLDLCTLPNDRLVMGVADVNGKPIVMGAEPVKVIGRVTAGDALVASDTPGYAMVNNDAPSLAIIAQALEDFDSTQGTIQAMILK